MRARRRPLARLASSLGSATLLALFACTEAGSSEAPTACTRSYDLLVATGDRTSSALVAIDTTSGAMSTRTGVDLGEDPVLAWSSGRAFWIARDDGVGFELEASCGAPVRRFVLGDEPHPRLQNPQDLAVDRMGNFWVPRFNDGSLLVLSPDGHREVISLAAYDAKDGNPEPSAVAVVTTPRGERAFITLERLDFSTVPEAHFTSTRASSLLEIDTLSRRVMADHPLLARNPYGPSLVQDSVLVMASPGSFDREDEPDAGVETFDPISQESKLVVSERDLGDSVVEARVTASCVVAVVAGAAHDVNPTSLVSWSRERGVSMHSADNSPLRTPGFDLRALFVTGSRLYVGERRARPDGKFSLHAFEMRPDCTLVATPERSLPLPQRPWSVHAKHE